MISPYTHTHTHTLMADFPASTGKTHHPQVHQPPTVHQSREQRSQFGSVDIQQIVVRGNWLIPPQTLSWFSSCLDPHAYDRLDTLATF